MKQFVRSIGTLITAIVAVQAVAGGRGAFRLPAADSLITISGTLNGASASALVKKPSVTLYSGQALDPLKPLPGTKKTYPVSIRNNRFFLRVPCTDGLAYMQMNVLQKRNFLTLFYTLVLPGDSIHIDFSGGNAFAVTGNASLRIDQQIRMFENIMKLSRYRASAVQGLAAMLGQWQSLRKDSSSVRSGPGTSESPAVRQLMASHYTSALDLTVYTTLRSLRYSMEPDARALALKYLDSVKNSIPLSGDSIIICHSLLYVKSVLRLNEGICIFSQTPRASFFGKIYQGIRQGYQGLLRDKLVLFAFWQLFGQYSQGNDFLDDALLTVKNDWSAKMLRMVWEAKRAGQKAFDFSLEDINGRKYRLADFKNKFVICHFWFYGCPGCYVLTSNTGDIVKKYSADTSVVFISINVDTDRAKWVNGLKKRIYTHPQELNLYTGGLGSRHPLVEHYHFVSFPQLVIINREGKVVTTNPPRAYDQQTAKQYDAMLEKIIYNRTGD